MKKEKLKARENIYYLIGCKAVAKIEQDESLTNKEIEKRIEVLQEALEIISKYFCI